MVLTKYFYKNHLLYRAPNCHEIVIMIYVSEETIWSINHKDIDQNKHLDNIAPANTV